MARNRMIKPKFWTSEQVLELSPIARLFFIGLWNFCDDAGRHPFSERSLKACIFPGDEISLADISTIIRRLFDAGLIILYEHEKQLYIQVTGWHHQRIERPTYDHPPFEGEGKHRKPLPISESARRSFDECSLLREEKRREEKLKESPASAAEALSRVRAREGPDADDADAAVLEIAQQCCEIAGITKPVNPSIVRSWLGWGLDPERDIYPVVRNVMQRRAVSDDPAARQPVETLSYFSKALNQWQEAKHQPVPRPGQGNGRSSPSPPAPILDRRGEIRRELGGAVVIWLSSGRWNERVIGTPAPGEPGSRVPEWLIATLEQEKGWQRPKPVRGIDDDEADE